MQNPVLLRTNVGYEPDAVFEVQIYVEGALTRPAGQYIGPIYLVASAGTTNGAWVANRQAIVGARFLEMPWIKVAAWPDQVRFHADRGPRVYQADRDVTVSISANYFVSSVTVRQTPLRGTDNHRLKIPADRLWIDWVFAHNGSGGGEGAGSMDGEDRVWNLGGITTSGWPLAEDLSIRCFYRCIIDDAPGLYEGKSTITALITP